MEKHIINTICKLESKFSSKFVIYGYKSNKAQNWVKNVIPKRPNVGART